MSIVSKKNQPNKRKLINDPVHGFIHLPTDLIADIVHHPFFQRLRRIKQLGLTEYVYPGALHTRFHHALGAMHLMGLALDELKKKGHNISKEEFEAAQIAVLLHDIGHGPFSHALEYTILKNATHEYLSLMLMRSLNEEFDNKLELAINIFENKYPRRFFNELISSQLDVDRLDYLQRDCFFTGVTEGHIAGARIIKLLDIVDDHVVVKAKGVYSIESFLTVRRLMYWQVYLHKTTVSTEQMLINIIKRAKFLVRNGHDVFSSTALKVFLKEDMSINDFEMNPSLLTAFASLDDYDIWGAIKEWQNEKDKILSRLSIMILNRRLFKVEISTEKPSKKQVDDLKEKVAEVYGISQRETKYFVNSGKITNSAYVSNGRNIKILTKANEVLDVAQASDLPNIKALGKIVKKYYLCYPKDVSL